MIIYLGDALRYAGRIQARKRIFATPPVLTIFISTDKQRAWENKMLNFSHIH